MWTPKRRIRKGKRLGSFLFRFPGLPLQLSYVFPCLPVHFNSMFLRAQNPVCSNSRSLEGICESAVQTLLTLATKLKSNKDHCWAHCSRVEPGKRRKFLVIHLVFCFFIVVVVFQSFRYASLIQCNKLHGIFCPLKEESCILQCSSNLL